MYNADKKEVHASFFNFPIKKAPFRNFSFLTPYNFQKYPEVHRELFCNIVHFSNISILPAALFKIENDMTEAMPFQGNIFLCDKYSLVILAESQLLLLYMRILPH